MDKVSLTQLCFTSFYIVFYGLILSRSMIWLPFTPSFTSTSGKWTGMRDYFRWVLSAIFLIFLPLAYWLYILYAIIDVSPAFQLPSKFWDISSFTTLGIIIVLILPPLGFYDLWLVIVKVWPNNLYSSEAQTQIEDVYRNAFSTGKLNTLFLAVLWIAGPLLILFLIQ